MLATYYWTINGWNNFVVYFPSGQGLRTIYAADRKFHAKAYFIGCMLIKMFLQIFHFAFLKTLCYKIKAACSRPGLSPKYQQDHHLICQGYDEDSF